VWKFWFIEIILSAPSAPSSFPCSGRPTRTAPFLKSCLLPENARPALHLLPGLLHLNESLNQDQLDTYFSDCLRLKLALVIFTLNKNFNDFLDFCIIFSEALESYLVTGESTVLIMLNLYYILSVIDAREKTLGYAFCDLLV